MASNELILKYLSIFSKLFQYKEINEEVVSVYAHYLKEIPDELFPDVCDKCIKECKFFPTVADIFERAEEPLQKWNSLILYKEDQEVRNNRIDMPYLKTLGQKSY